MGAWKLSDADWGALDNVRFSATEASVFRNATIVLMTALGRSKTSIAHDLGCSPATVDNVRKHYREHGVDALTPRKPPGRTSRATPEYRAALRQAVETPPQQLGYGFSVWSVVRLAQHLKKVTGIAFSDDQLRRILHDEGFSFQRPKHTMKGKRDEAAYDKARRQLKTLKKKALADDTDFVLIFQDEMEIHRHPALTRMWARVGHQPEVPAPGKNEKKVVYGGVDYKTGKLTYTVAETKCGASFLLFLSALLLAYTGRKIRMVCDNGRFHTTKAVMTFLAEHQDKIEVYWLPPYCPSLNLIERLWGHLKRTVLANVLYRCLDDLVVAFRRGVQRLTGKRERMRFMFDHDDLIAKSLPRSWRTAA